MIEIRYSPQGLPFQVDIDERTGLIQFPVVLFKSPTPKSATPPSLPPPAVTTPTEIIEAAGKAGEQEGRRLRKRTGRRATRMARPDLANIPANIAQAGLKTSLG